MPILRCAGQDYPLDGDLVLGRHSDCHIRIPDMGISRRQARFWLQDGQVWVENLSSAVALLVRGEPIVLPRRLEPGDIVLINTNEVLVVGETNNGPAGDTPFEETNLPPSAAPGTSAWHAAVGATPPRGIDLTMMVPGPPAAAGEPAAQPFAHQSSAPQPSIPQPSVPQPPLAMTFLGAAPPQAAPVPPATGDLGMTFLGPGPSAVPQQQTLVAAPFDATIVADLSGGDAIRIARGAVVDGRTVNMVTDPLPGWSLLSFQEHADGSEIGAVALAVGDEAGRAAMAAQAQAMAKAGTRQCRLAGHGVVEGRPFLIARPGPGVLLPDLLERCGRVTPAPALAAMANLMRQLAELHAASIAHAQPVIGQLHAGDDGLLRAIPAGAGWLGTSGHEASQADDITACAGILHLMLGDEAEPWSGVVGREFGQYLRKLAPGERLCADLAAAADAADDLSIRLGPMAWPPPAKGGIIGRWFK